MKKQILFVAFLVLAVFANVNKSFGQDSNILTGAPACTPAVPINCAGNDDALHPLPGESYAYTITTTPAAVGTVHWYVTDDADVLAARTGAGARDVINGTYVLAASGAYDDPANTSLSVDVSWKSFDGGAHNVLLVAYVTGAAGCSDNIEVFRIMPTFGFTLDIAGLLNNGTIGNVECISPVVSATYDGTNLTMDYGDNYVFFSVNAANFVDSWMPTFTAAVTGGSTIDPATIQWAYPADAQANTAWHAATVAVEAQNATNAVGAAGECIVVRVQVDHNAIENDAIAGSPVVTLGVNGIMYDPASNGYALLTNRDLDTPAVAGPCDNAHTDEATYTITARPALVDATAPVPVNPGFEPKN